MSPVVLVHFHCTSSSTSEFSKPLYPKRWHLHQIQARNALCPPPLDKVIALPNYEGPLRQCSTSVLGSCDSLRSADDIALCGITAEQLFAITRDLQAD